MAPLPTRLVSAVRLAATAGHSANEVVAALEDGAWAARHGLRVPPFALLDVRTVLSELAVGRTPTVPQRHGTGHRCSAAESYDDWLNAFARQLLARLGRANLAAIAMTAQDGGWAVGPHLPPLLSAWPDEPDSPDDTTRDWEEAYRFAAVEPDGVAQAISNWSGARDTRVSSWKAWRTPTADVPPEPLLLARFAADLPGERLHERFDQAAAEFYLRAADPRPRAELESRLQGEQNTLSPLDRPIVESFEEQHPFVGAPTVYTYTLGEYGLFKLANRTDPRLSTPPRAHRPQPFEIHLGWAVGYRGIRAGTPLQGLVALLLDDWRAALAKHRLTFHLHRFGAGRADWTPKPGSAMRAILPGKRWRNELLGETAGRGRARTGDGPTVPPGVVGMLFHRPSLADAGPVTWAFGGRGEPTPDARKWWCGVMLRDELERDLGFRAVGDGDPPTWTGPAGALPRALRHLVVVDAARETGWVCATDFAAGRIGLRPSRGADDFGELRANALAALAEVLFELAPV